MQLRLTSGEVIALKKSDSIFTALKDAGIYLVASCGAKGICGKCKVRVIEGDVEEDTHGTLNANERKSGLVLACQTFPLGDILVSIPKESRLIVGDQIAVSKTKNLIQYLRSYGVDIDPFVKTISLNLPVPNASDSISDLERLRRSLTANGLDAMVFRHGFVTTMGKVMREAGWKVVLTYIDNVHEGREAISLQPQSVSGNYGLAIDIGTTTVVVYLADMATGKVIDIGSSYNSQIRYGDDVITRIVVATEKGGLQELRDTVVSDINTITESMIERHGISSDMIHAAVVAGNTTMAHIFWNLDPGSIREEPYIPEINNFPFWRASTAGLSIHPEARIYTVPCVASYVGGDIVAGVLASKMHLKDELALFMDIGTNGEIAIGNKEWLMTAACSAGPCFEGSGIKCGMRATPGAIESVRIDPATLDPSITVVGGGSPLGICGTGMIDAVSEMLLAGVINQKGKFLEGNSYRIRRGDDGLEYVIYSDKKIKKDIVLTEVDLENLIRAKAAIYAGVSTLLAEAGLGMDAVERVYIAGGFGNYLEVDKAVLLGMLPDLPEEKFTYLGNTSITGAYLCLLSEDLRKEAEDIASKMTYIELSLSRMFMDEYVSALFVPHTNMNLFPSVASRLMTAMTPMKFWLMTNPEK
ncbi:MAG TPA: ASKHA domain-containing protein [Dissulfurispiraceae bacterium]|nr:ASKHA domain-containing protein [Dissulfurispiraceae bacterium]